MSKRKGILLAGGSGSRLRPLTNYIIKQFCPVYDKPMIYYPLYTLMKTGIKDILVISTPESTPVIARNLGDGSRYGCRFIYRIQEKPDGLAQAFVLGREFIGKDKVCLILGDNIFYGAECQKLFKQAAKSDDNIVFGYQVADPERYGVVEFDDVGNALSIEEKPKKPKSNYAVPGIYFYNNDVVDIAANLKPSARGEYEITDVNREYLKRKDLKVMKLGLGNAYLDTGTFQSLSDASNFIRTIQERTGLRVSDIEEFRVHEKDQEI